MIGKMLGLSRGSTYRNFGRGNERALLIKAGNMEGYELDDEERNRSKLKDSDIEKFQDWVLNECELVIDNPFKNDTIIKRDRKNRMVRDDKGDPIMIQKKLLIGSFRELHMYTVANYEDMKVDGDKLLFSEATLRRIMPKHIKRATQRYKVMCGCTMCVIFTEMHQCLLLWRGKKIKHLQQVIDTSNHGRAKTKLEKELCDYKAKVMRDGKLFPERAWDAPSVLACRRVEIGDCPRRKGGLFHKFSCVMRECPNCPPWPSTVPEMEKNALTRSSSAFMAAT